MADFDIWVVAEHKEEELQDISLEMLGAARRLADQARGEVVGLALGTGLNSLADALARAGADRQYLVESPHLEQYQGELSVEALAPLLQAEMPAVLLCAATSQGNDLAARLAARLGVGLASQCVGFRMRDQGLQIARSCFGGRAVATVEWTGQRPCIMTASSGVFAPAPTSAARQPQPRAITPSLAPDGARVKTLEFIPADPRTVDITEAEVIVTGGLGMGDREGFWRLQELADLLGGSVGATRPVVDYGWAPIQRQVGLTGRTVSPRLYVACGLSGAPQHLQGMKGSKTIIAINKDRNAPILKEADVAIVGDIHQLLPVIIAKAKGE